MIIDNILTKGFYNQTKHKPCIISSEIYKNDILEQIGSDHIPIIVDLIIK